MARARALDLGAMRIGFRERRRGMIDKILRPKRAEVARMLASPLFPPRHAPRADVASRLARASGEPLRLIAEIKFRSPSAGDLSRILSAGDRAVAYAEAGASMVSVLCDRSFFGGCFEDLAAARAALDARFGDARPLLLAKEFIVHPIQLDRAKDAGADAALVIVRILAREKVVEIVDEARARGLEPLVEVASEDELAAALEAGARVVGVNARDLDTLRMDADRAARVLASIPRDVVAVHLSGLATPADVARVASGRADAALIGEALMREDDPRQKLAAMTRAACG